MGIAQEQSSIDLSLEQYQTVKRLLKKYIPNIEVWAYGSRVKWTSTPESDLDLVAFSTLKQKQAIADLKEAFEESKLIFRVDLFIWDEIPQQFHDNIEIEKVIFQRKYENKLRNIDWPLKTVSEVAQFLNNKRIPLKSLDRDKRKGCYPYYGASGIVDYIDDFIFDGTYLLISEDGENLRSRNTPIAFKAYGKFWVNNHAHILEEKEEGILDYLESYFSTLNLAPYITGAVQPKLNKANLDAIEIPIPPKKERLQINSQINGLNKKISINRQINQTLEQMAQALFKSWFVDFDPVKAKMKILEAGGTAEQANLAAMQVISGKTEAQLETMQSTQPEQYCELKATAELFPDAMQESELGAIPVGWEVVRFKKIVEKYIDNRGKTPPLSTNGIPLIEVKHIPKDSIKPNLNTVKYVDQETYDSWFRAHLEPDDIVISTVGTIGRICLVPNNEPFVIAQNLLGLRFLKEKVSSYFMYYQMDGFRFRHDIDARLVITVQASIKRKDLETIDLLQPSIKIQNAFDKIVISPVKQQQSNQNIALTQLRDTLLPKLLSGEMVPSKLEIMESLNG